MNNLWRDLCYGSRMLMKNPGFTLVAVGTLALGIGASTVIFSVVNTVLLRPLGFPDSERIVALWEDRPGEKQQRWRVAPANFYDWREQSRSFDEVAAFGAAAMTLTGAGEPEQLRGGAVTPQYFRVLGVDPVLGRGFLPEESQPGKNRVVILSRGVWDRRFGADQQIVGKMITLDDASYSVVGVMPPGLFPVWPGTTGKFSFDQSQQQFWVPRNETGQTRSNRRSHVLGVIGRLRNGVDLRQAQTEMDGIAAQLAQQYPQFNEGEGIVVRPFADELVGNVRRGLLILFGAVGLVLLISCANVAGLLLARYAARQKEVAIRAALGAGHARLIRQFLTEGLLLALVGGALGVWLAALGIDWLPNLVPEEIPRFTELTIDHRVLGFGLMLSLTTSLLFSLAPAIYTANADVQRPLQEGGRGSAGARSQGFRKALVTAQICLAVMLMIGAGLLIRSYQQLQLVSPGFNPDRMLVAELVLNSSRYAHSHQVVGFYSQLLEQVRQLPGVEAAALTYDHPLEANWIDSFSIEGRPGPATGESLSAWLRIVSEGYFRAAGVELLRGREFTPLDGPERAGAAIVNEAFAQQYFANEDPLGKQLLVTTPSRVWGQETPTSFEIVGIVRNVKFLGLNAEPAPAYYLPDTQFPQQHMALLVRASGDPLTLTESLRSAVLSIDPNQPIATMTTMESLMAGQTAQHRFTSTLMGAFGAAALLLAMIGIFGLLTYQVARQTPEFGIRIALGAQRRDIIRLVIGEGMRLALIGGCAGLLGAFALTRLMANLLFGVSATDPLTFVVTALVLISVGMLACWIPARRATKIDPLVALRSE